MNDQGDLIADAPEMERLRAAEAFAWRCLTLMWLGCTAEQILHPADELQTWANLATRDGILREDDPEGKDVPHTAPFPDGPVIPGYER